MLDINIILILAEEILCWSLIRVKGLINDPHCKRKYVLKVNYQTRGRVFHSIFKHREVVDKTRRSRVFFYQLHGVWISDETPFGMSDIASQTINNFSRKSK